MNMRYAFEFARALEVRPIVATTEPPLPNAQCVERRVSAAHPWYARGLRTMRTPRTAVGWSL